MNQIQRVATSWVRFQARIAKPHFLAYMVLLSLIIAGIGVRRLIETDDQRELFMILFGVLLALQSFEKLGFIA
jgi:hypothetical protein